MRLRMSVLLGTALSLLAEDVRRPDSPVPACLTGRSVSW